MRENVSLPSTPTPYPEPCHQSIEYCFQIDLVKIKFKNSALGTSGMDQWVKAHAVMVEEEKQLCKLSSDLNIMATAYMLSLSHTLTHTQ